MRLDLESLGMEPEFTLIVVILVRYYIRLFQEIILLYTLVPIKTFQYLYAKFMIINKNCETNLDCNTITTDVVFTVYSDST